MFTNKVPLMNLLHYGGTGRDPGVRTNWNRLATYSFSSTTNQVTESHWHWTQRVRVSRSYAGNMATACVARNCNVQTGNGFQSTSAPDHLTGTYTVANV
jgi:hypothetical protein